MSTSTKEQKVRFSPRTDATTFEVLRHRLWQINDEQGKTLINMSGSQVATEANDFNVGISDAEGNLVAVGPYILVQVASLSMLIQSAIRVLGDKVRPGDVFLCNDPWYGAVHHNDVCVLAPFFWEGKIAAWTASVIHQVDVGGGTPGSWCHSATDTFQEAPRYRYLQVVREGELQETVVDTYLTNSRTPDLLNLDLRAQIGSAKTALTRLGELFERYGAQTVKDTMADMLDYSEALFVNKLATIPAGEWLSECYMDHDGHKACNYRYALRLTKDDDGLTFDYTGTDPQIEAFINCPYGGLFIATYVGLLVYMCADIPWNAGFMRRIRIVSEEGTLNNARFPAAVSGSLESIWNTTNTVCAALGKMLCLSEAERDSAMAVWQGSTQVYTLFGTNQHNESYGTWIIASGFGGAGARTFGDGHDNSGALMAPRPAVINVEHAEDLYPVLFLYRRRATDSGGPGLWRGGVSADHAITPHRTKQIAVGVTSSGGDHSHTLGLAGGYPGGGSVVRVSRKADPTGSTLIPSQWDEVGGSKESLPPKLRFTLEEGDVFSIIPHGGGGYGDPLDRDPELVLRDVVDRLVSVEGARRYYGVIVEGTPASVNIDATARHRLEVRRGRVGQSADEPLVVPAPGHGHGVTWKQGNWTCAACEADLGPISANAKQSLTNHHRELVAAGPLLAAGTQGQSANFHLSEYNCPSCGTMLAVDQPLKSMKGHWHDVRPAG